MKEEHFIMKSKKGYSDQTNLENLVDFIEDEGENLVPVFLTLLEMCFHSEEHCFDKFKVTIR